MREHTSPRWTVIVASVIVFCALIAQLGVVVAIVYAFHYTWGPWAAMAYLVYWTWNVASKSSKGKRR